MIVCSKCGKKAERVAPNSSRCRDCTRAYFRHYYTTHHGRSRTFRPTTTVVVNGLRTCSLCQHAFPDTIEFFGTPRQYCEVHEFDLWTTMLLTPHTNMSSYNTIIVAGLQGTERLPAEEPVEVLDPSDPEAPRVFGGLDWGDK